MANDRASMLQELKEVLVPALRARGFQGSLPHFRRIGRAQIDLLTIQFDRHGGGFVAEISKCPADGVAHSSGTWIAPTRVTAHDVTRRLRLGAVSESRDHWFRYDGIVDRLLRGDRRFRRLAENVVALLDRQAEPWWSDA